MTCSTVLAAADDEVVAVPQVVAIKALFRAASVAVRVEPGRHLSLFMGRRTLGGAWRDTARWPDGGAGIASSPEIETERGVVDVEATAFIPRRSARAIMSHKTGHRRPPWIAA